MSSSRNRKENCSICIELIPWKKKTNQERKVKLMSVSCQHPHEIVYTPKAARKSFFICFSSCLLLFRLKLWKNADCALRLREQFVTSLSALFPKYYMLDEGTKGEESEKISKITILCMTLLCIIFAYYKIKRCILFLLLESTKVSNSRLQSFCSFWKSHPKKVSYLS